MKPWTYRDRWCLRLGVWLVVVGIAWIPSAMAGTLDKPAMSKDKIRVTSETLTTNAEANYAEFSGNVNATQGEAAIKADRLRIYYTPDKKSGQGPPGLVSDSTAIQKIVASGNVRMHMDGRQALADRAEYVLKTEIMTLTGKRPKITEGQNLFTADKITFYRKDGRVDAQGNIVIEFFPEGKVLQ